MTDNKNEMFADDVCHCIECAVNARESHLVDAPPYFYCPDDEEKMEILRNEKEYGLLGE